MTIRRHSTIVAAVGAAMVSLALLWWGGASRGWLGLQAGAAMAAVALVLVLVPNGARRMAHWSNMSWLPFLLTVIFDRPVDGVYRWLGIGFFRIHVGLVVLVPTLLASIDRATWRTAAKLSAIAAIVALQPDRGTALVLLLGCVSLLACHRNWFAALPVATSAAAFGCTLYRADPLDPVPMVEHVLTDAWAHGWWVGAACWLVAIALCLAPAIERGWSKATIIFAIGWGGFFLASLIGAYPVPLLGFGVSGWLGWALSVRQLREVVRA